MHVAWSINDSDIARVKALIDSCRENPFVRDRIEWNLRSEKPRATKEDFWKNLVACLVTSRQPSGPKSRVADFIRTDPFPLRYDVCLGRENLQPFAAAVLAEYSLRFSNRIAGFIAKNLALLEQGHWESTLPLLDELRTGDSPEIERKVAQFLDGLLWGVGPKQSRNLLQALGLTRYEVPIDSRVAGWLSDFGFPLPVTREVLNDQGCYEFILDGFQELCRQSGVYPCVLDAAIFASKDKDAWTDGNIFK